MIKLGDRKIEYAYMGRFTTKERWIHPEACERTFEIIYVTEGSVFLEQEGNEYELHEKDLIILCPGVIHRGSRYSEEGASFYWIHFTMNHEKNETEVIQNFPNASLIKELMHYANKPNCSQYVKDSILVHLLSLISLENENSKITALAADIFEWTRINAAGGLTVKKVADHFGYNSEYLSRLIRKQYGQSLKTLIDGFLIEKAKNYLNNTRYSVKEISTVLGFSSPNTFINFFKYHEEKTPAKYRNSYSNTHMNKK